MKKNFCDLIITQVERSQQLCLELETPQKPTPEIKKKQIFQPNQLTLRKPCKKCGNQSAKVGAGRKGGEASLSCSACKGFIGWFPSNQLKKLAKLGGEG